MSLLFSKEIISVLSEELKAANTSVQIISAYCKIETIKKLNEIINSNVRSKRIMLRFRLDDIIKGSTDFEVLDFCLSNNWEVFIRFDLHAKTYIVDNKRGMVGSANATPSGLTGNRKPNYEIASLVELEQQDLDKINRMFKDALYIDEELYKKLKRQVKTVEYGEFSQAYYWSSDIESMFKPHITTLFSFEFPENKNLEEQLSDYISFLDISKTSSLVQIKEAFRWSNVYLWLLSSLADNNGELYFGTLSQLLHRSLIEDPKPQRKEVKELLVNLLGWVESLKMEEVIVDRPNYSQRIRLNKNE